MTSTVSVPSTSTSGVTYTLTLDEAGQAIRCTCLGHSHHGHCTHADTHNGAPAQQPSRPRVALQSRTERIATRKAMDATASILTDRRGMLSVQAAAEWGDPLALIDEAEQGW